MTNAENYCGAKAELSFVVVGGGIDLSRKGRRKSLIKVSLPKT